MDHPVECVGCGWKVPESALHDHDATLILQEHGEKFCAKPPYDPPYSA